MNQDIIITCAWLAFWIFLAYITGRDLIKSFRSLWKDNETAQMLKKERGTFQALIICLGIFFMAGPAFCYYVAHTKLALSAKRRTIMDRYEELDPTDYERLISLYDKINAARRFKEAMEDATRRPHVCSVSTDTDKLIQIMLKYMVLKTEIANMDKRCEELGKRAAIVRLIAHLTYCDWLSETIASLKTQMKEEFGE